MVGVLGAEGPQPGQYQFVRGGSGGVIGGHGEGGGHSGQLQGGGGGVHGGRVQQGEGGGGGPIISLNILIGNAKKWTGLGW